MLINAAKMQFNTYIQHVSNVYYYVFIKKLVFYLEYLVKSSAISNCKSLAFSPATLAKFSVLSA